MMRFVLCFLLVLSLSIGASALEIEAPAAPDSAQALMPEDTVVFSDALQVILKKAVDQIVPSYSDAVKALCALVTIVMILSLSKAAFSNENTVTDLVGCGIIAYTNLSSANTMINLAAETVHEICDYGMLLMPVMTTALAAQGGVSSSASLYAGTALFNYIISWLLSNALIPLIYVFLAISIANSVTGEDALKNISVLIKRVITWTLKTLVTVFTTYMSITGVVSGTTDIATLKATKTVISSAVPIIGGILSDSSEAILVGAELAKNTAGIYGILVILSLFLSPFLKIGVHYLGIKAAYGICSIFGSKRVVAFIDDFSSAMGMLLAMTGAVCVLFLISTICFMKGMS